MGPNEVSFDKAKLKQGVVVKKHGVDVIISNLDSEPSQERLVNTDFDAFVEQLNQQHFAYQWLNVGLELEITELPQATSASVQAIASL